MATTIENTGAGHDQEKAGKVFVEDGAVQGSLWMYRPLKIGSWTGPWFASPETQLILVSFVCFLCPGMFNALNGLGGAGQLNPHDVNDSNTALYSTFAVVGFFAGTIANRVGLKLTLSFGGFGYFLYSASLLSYNRNLNVGFLIFAGALLGICAGLLWCAQGAVMMSYPLEHQKGTFIAVFWVIFNLGGVIGSLVIRFPSPLPSPPRVWESGSGWDVGRSIGPLTVTRSRFRSAKISIPRRARSTMAPTSRS
jgi:MFS family permease